jgi:hypothetical protein
MRWGDDADGEPGTDTSWINIRSGVAVEIEYSSTEYEMAQPEDEVDAKLTGRVRITREQIFAADFLIDSLTGEEKD